MSHTGVAVFHKQTEHYWFFCFLVLTENITDLPCPTFIYLLFIGLNPGRVQHHMDSVSNGLCRKVASEVGRNHATVSMGLSYFSPDRLLCLQVLLCCFLLCMHKHISFPRRIQFHLRHKHFQFKEHLCALSGSGDFIYSQLKWICTTAIPSRPQESASKVNSKNFPHLHRYQDGGKGLFSFDLRSQTKNGELICKAENGKVHCFCFYP